MAQISTGMMALMFCVFLSTWAHANDNVKSSGAICVSKETPLCIYIDQKDAIAAFAAAELQKYVIKTVKGVNPLIKNISAMPDRDDKKTVVFILGHNRLTQAKGMEKDLKSLKPEGFIIKAFDGNTIILTGNDGAGKPTDFQTETGTLFAVYTFLERFLGVRWVSPGEGGEVVREQETVALPGNIDITEEPDFAIRNIKYCFAKSIPGETLEEFDLWKKRNKMGYVPKVAFGHSYSNHMKGNFHFEAHPEYFALVAGKRRPVRKEAMGAQYCTTEPNVIDLFARDIIENSDKNRNLTSVSPNDGQGFCECPRCRALDVPGAEESGRYSDRVYTFVNEVARRVKEKKPDTLLGMFAYTFYRKPPVKTTKLEPNVVVALTLYSYEYRDDASQKIEFDLVGDWSRIASKMVAREYHGTCMWLSMPNIQFECIAKQMPMLKKCGFIGMHSEGAPDWATHGVDYYVLAKSLWNSSTPLERILDDYYTASYGAAAPHIRRCHERIQETVKKNWRKRKGVGWADTIAAIPDLFPIELFQECRNDIQKAYEMAQDDPTKTRIEMVEKGIEYSETTSKYISLLREVKKYGIDVAGFGSERKTVEELKAPGVRHNLKTMVKEAIALGDKRLDIVKNNIRKHFFNDEAFTENARKWLATLKNEERILNLADEQRFDLPTKWKFKIDPDDQGESNGFSKTDYDDSSWNEIRTDNAWEEQGYGAKEFPENGNEGYNGVAWYRCKTLIPEKAGGKRAFLLMRGLDEKGWIYLNGQLAAENKGGSYFRIDLSKYLKTGEENVFALKVIDERKTGGFYAPALIEFPDK